MSLDKYTWHQILLDIPIEELPKVCQINLITKEICQDDLFWKDRLFNDYGLDPELQVGQTYQQLYQVKSNVFKPFEYNYRIGKPEYIDIRSDIWVTKIIKSKDGYIVLGLNGQVYFLQHGRLTPYSKLNDVIDISSHLAVTRDGKLHRTYYGGGSEEITSYRTEGYNYRIAPLESKVVYIGDHLNIVTEDNMVMGFDNEMGLREFKSPNIPDALIWVDQSGSFGVGISGQVWNIHDEVPIPNLKNIVQVISKGFYHFVFALDRNGQLFAKPDFHDPFEQVIFPDHVGRIKKIYTYHKDGHDYLYFINHQNVVYRGRLKYLDDFNLYEYNFPEVVKDFRASYLTKHSLGIGEIIKKPKFRFTYSTKLPYTELGIRDWVGNHLVQVEFDDKDWIGYEINMEDKMWIRTIDEEKYGNPLRFKFSNYNEIQDKIPEATDYRSILEYPNGDVAMLFIIDSVGYLAKVKWVDNQVYPGE